MPIPKWNFEADYFTACNCDWGCPCNFNARPTEGRCMGWGAWRIVTGKFGDTSLDGTKLVIYYKFSGLVENGNGTACAYVDSRASEEQQRAVKAITEGEAGGGFFELFGKMLVSKWLAMKVVPIDFEIIDGIGHVRVDGFGEGESELLAYPDGSTIRPYQELPHGIEFKRALMTNAKRWWWRDDDLLASYADNTALSPGSSSPTKVASRDEAEALSRIFGRRPGFAGTFAPPAASLPHHAAHARQSQRGHDFFVTC